MSKEMVYALNKVSNVVSRIDRDLLSHPVIGRDLVEVDDPHVCIDCGVQPDQVTTVEGEDIVLSAEPEEEPKEAPKPPKPTRKDK